MSKSLKILCLIPARGGSKRLPGKNKKILGGLPLLVWSIRSAKSIPEICDILVSTDDLTIAKIAKREGAIVPWLRPRKLASDSAKSVEVALHALEWYLKKKQKIDGLILFQPTSPFRKKKSIRQAIKLFKTNKFKAVVSVSKKEDKNINWLYSQKPCKIINVKSYKNCKFEYSFFLNGNIYLTKPCALMKEKSFFQKKTVALWTHSKEESIDIDTAKDFAMAQAICKKRSVIKC